MLVLGGVPFVPVKLVSSGMDVLSSGSALLFSIQEQSLDLVLAGMQVTLSFTDDGADPSIEFETTGNVLLAKLRNFTNPLGIGPTEALKIGQFEGRDLYLRFVVYAMSADSPKVVHYTFYANRIA